MEYYKLVRVQGKTLKSVSEAMNDLHEKGYEVALAGEFMVVMRLTQSAVDRWRQRAAEVAQRRARVAAMEAAAKSGNGTHPSDEALGIPPIPPAPLVIPPEASGE